MKFKVVELSESAQNPYGGQEIWGARVTTVFPRQGHYAHDPNQLKNYPSADVSIDRIGDLLQYDLPQLIGASTRKP